MKSRIANRVLLTAVMALVLGALLAVSSFAAIGLTEDGFLAGTEAGKSYTAAPYDILAGTAGTAQPVDKTTDFDTLGAGVWAVSDGTTTTYVFVKGTQSGQLSYWDATNNTVLANIQGDRTIKVLTAGMWTRANNGSYKTTGPVTVDENGVSIVLGTATTQKASIADTELLYGLTKDQIIPANALTSWSFSIDFPDAYTTGYSAADLSGAVNFYVKAPGETEATAYSATLAGKDSGAVTINAPAALANSDGYIVGIGVQPWKDWNVASTSPYTAANAPATIILNKGVNTLTYTLKYAAPDVEVTGITLNKTTANLSVGDVLTLEATIDPDNATDKNVKWSNDAPAVVSINNNVVTAIAAGTANVTVTTTNGKFATCAITVTAEPALPNHEGLSVTLAGTVDGLEDGKTYTIQAYDVITGTKGAKSALTATTVVDSGVWYVSNGEKGGYVFVAGEKSGEISFWDIANNKNLGNQTNAELDKIVPGMWSRSSNGAYTTITYYSNATNTETTICFHVNKDKFLQKADGAADYAGATPKTGADNLLQESVIYYGFTAEQVVPASMVKDVTSVATTTKTGALAYNTGKTSADHKGTFTFYVKNPVTGDTETYVVDTVGDQKVFTAPAAMAESEGYLIGFAFAPYANSADDLFVCAPTDLAATNGYGHFGFKADVNKINLKDAALPAPTGISVVDGKVTGLEDGKYYQYAPVTLATGGVLTIGTPATLDGNATPEGLFVVRESNAAGTAYTAWTEDYLYIAGSSINDIFHTEKKTGAAGTYKDQVIDVPVIVDLGGPTVDKVKINSFTTGKWSGFLIGHGLQLSYSFTPLIIGSTSCYIYTEIANYLDATDATVKAQKQAQAQEISNGVYFSYGYESDEIIEMENWDSYKFKVTRRQGGLSVTSGALKTRVTLFVVTEDGQVEERVALYDTVYDGSGKTITINQSDFADNSGYIVGMKIQPYFAPEGTVLTPTSKTAVDYNLTLIADGYKVVLPKQPTPTGLYVENGTIKGMDATKTYAWAYQYVDSQSDATTLPAGTTELSGKTGLISIMIPGDGVTTNNSDPVIFYVPGSADGRATLGQISGGKPAYKSGSDFIVGTWTGSNVTGWYDQTTGAYSFLDQNAVAASDAQTLWLYQNTKEQAQARLNADAAKSAAEGVPQAWKNSNVTSKPSRLQAVIDSFYAAPDYADTLEANKAAHQTKIAESLESRYIQYAYDETEIIPVDQLLEMSFASKSRQSDYKFTATPKAIFYVMDSTGAVTEYTAMGPTEEYVAGVWKKTTIDIQSIENWPAEGWVVAVKFYPVGEVDDATVIFAKTDMRVDASNLAFSFTQHHISSGYYYAPYTSYVIMSPAEAPTFEVTANAAGEGFDITITNASSANVYEYKGASETSWTTLPAGTATFTVPEVGTYTVKVSGELLIGTAEADCVVTLLTPATPEFEAVINTASDFKVNITNWSKTYNYEYKAEADTDWTAIDGKFFIVGAAGKYNVRASGEVWDGYATADVTVEAGTPVAPAVSVVPGLTDFTITIKNYSDLYVYEYKLDTETDWTAVPAGEASFVITAGGEYTLRAGGVVWNGYAEKGFRAVEVPAAIRTLVIDNKTGVLTGLDASLAYEYAKVNYAGISDTWTAIPAGTEYTFAEPALYAIRLAATGTEDASTPMVFSVLGSIADRGTIYNTYTKSYPNGTYNNPNNKQMEVIKWQSFNAFNAIEFIPGSWTGAKIGDLAYWNTGWGKHVGATTCYMTYGAWGGALKNGTLSLDAYKAQMSAYKFRYAYEDAEIVHVTDLEKMTFTAGTRQGHVKQTAGKVYANVIFYIASPYGEIEEIVFERPADLTNSATGATVHTTYEFSAADFEDVDGYIVAIDVIPFAEFTDDTVLTVPGSLDQDVSIILKDYQVKLPRLDAPTGLTFNEDTALVEGLDPDIEYYYAPYTVNGVGETKYVSGVESLELPVGLWGVGIVSDDPEYADSLPYIVFVRGEEADRLDLGTAKPDGYYMIKDGDIWEQGTWTGREIGTHSSFGTNGLSTLGGHVTGTHAKNLKAAIDSGDKAVEAVARQAVADVAETVQFKYAFANEEVIPSNEILNFRFDLSKRMGSINLGAGVTAKVTFFVVDKAGNISEYVWEEETSTTAVTKHDIDVQAIENWPLDGYVVAIEVNPWTKVNPENVVVLDSNNYNTMALIHITGYVIKLNPGLPNLTTFAAPEGGLGEIANMNSAMDYEIKTWDEAAGEYSDWVKVPAGSTSFLAPAGKYLVRVAESRNFTASDAVEVIIEQVGAFRTVENETKKIHLASDFTEVKADYEIDVTSKIWVATLALNNLKITSPDSTIAIVGNGYKFALTGAQIATDELIHYYNFQLSFDGSSRHDTVYDEIKELAGEDYIIEFFIESTEALPFEEAELYIYVGTEFDGANVELRGFNERIGKLRKVEESVVEDGWAKFTNYETTYVVVKAE